MRVIICFSSFCYLVVVFFGRKTQTTLGEDAGDSVSDRIPRKFVFQVVFLEIETPKMECRYRFNFLRIIGGLVVET